MLVLHRVEVRRSDDPTIRHASLCAESPGLLFLVGGGGAGKSSLLAALSGDTATVRLSGLATLQGKSIAAGEVRSVWLPQHLQLDGDEPAHACLTGQFGVAAAQAARWLEEAGIGNGAALLAEPAHCLPQSVRRYLAVLAVLQKPGALYLVDEPTADLDEAAATQVRARLKALATHACVIAATHNRLDCHLLGGRTALLAGGTVQECADTSQFFDSPATSAGRTYIETGNCSLPVGVPRSCQRDGIWWLVPGLLCGMSRPGLVAAAPIQFNRLSQEGVRLLVCTEEICGYSADDVRGHGLQWRHFSIRDMTPPSFSQAVDVCRLAEPTIRSNGGVAVHCRGGLGRTGTVLAAILVWFGDAPADAIAKVRAARPAAIQTVSQSRFVYTFADRVRNWQ